MGAGRAAFWRGAVEMVEKRLPGPEFSTFDGAGALAMGNFLCYNGYN